MRRKIGILLALVLMVPFVYICLEYLRYFRHYTGISFGSDDKSWGF